MVHKLNNIIQTGTKFNHKVDSKQTVQNNNNFEKSLEKVISDDKKGIQKNQKINKKNKTDVSLKSKENKQKQNIFTPFSEKNLPKIPENIDIKNNCINNNNTNDNIIHHFFNDIQSTSDIENNNNTFVLPQILNDSLPNGIPNEDKTEIIEAKLQLINEFFIAINNGLNNKRKTEINEINNLKNIRLADIESGSLPLRNKLSNNILSLDDDDNIEGKNNKSKDTLITQEPENLINKTLNELDKKAEKNDVKLNFNVPSTDSQKNVENIQHRVEKNTQNDSIEQKKSDNKIQFSKKNISDTIEKNQLSDNVKEQILEITNSTKNINNTSSKSVTTYNQFGQIRIQEFTQTTLQLIKATPENSTSTANLVLKPESLGTLFVQISMTDNKAKINIMADTSEAIKTIEQQIGALKEKLSQNGIITDSIDIGFKSKDGDEKLSNYNSQFTKQQDKKQKEEIKEYLKSLNNLQKEENAIL